MLRIIFIFLILLAHTTVKASGPTVHFERFSVNQGLSQTSVSVILQDSRGFLWLGTDDGLNRFDGYEFKVFRHDSQIPSSISSNHILSLVEDRNGDIWVGTKQGLNRFDVQSEQIWQLPYT